MTGRHLKPELEAELDKLLLRVRIELRRGNFSEAEKASRAALAIVPDAPDAHEALGDILREQGKLEEAVAEYKIAMGGGGDRPSAETRFAETVLAIEERAHAKALAQDMLENPHLYVTRSKKPGLAMLLSLCCPGLGQLYNGEFVKAGVVFGTFLLFMISIPLLQHYPPTVGSVQDLIQNTNPVVSILGFISAAAYIYGAIDAPSTADKSSKAETELFKKHYGS